MPFQKLITGGFNHWDLLSLSAVLQQRVCPDDVIKEEPKTLIHRALLPGGIAAIVKIYRHRPWFNCFRQPLSCFRAQREFEALSFQVKKEISCSRPICWGYGRDSQSGCFECLVSIMPDALCRYAFPIGQMFTSILTLTSGRQKDNEI